MEGISRRGEGRRGGRRRGEGEKLYRVRREVKGISGGRRGKKKVKWREEGEEGSRGEKKLRENSVAINYILYSFDPSENEGMTFISLATTPFPAILCSGTLWVVLEQEVGVVFCLALMTGLALGMVTSSLPVVLERWAELSWGDTSSCSTN